MMQTIRLRGVDPLLFRDGRPFAAELGAQRADSLPVPYPGVIAGAVRTAVGPAAGWKWETDGPTKALALVVYGPVVCIGDGKPVVAAPADAVIYRKDNEKKNPLQCMCLRPREVPTTHSPQNWNAWNAMQCMCLRPREVPTDSGCNMPDGLRPVEVTNEEKPERGYSMWLWSDLEKWLAQPGGAGFDPLPKDFCNIGLPAVEERTHVQIGPNGIAEDGMLFTTASVVPLERRRDKDGKKIERDWSYVVRVASDTDIRGPLFLGGERRVAIAETGTPTDWPACSADLQQKLAASKRIRMVLVTPAIFSGGWRPGWAGGAPPGVSGLKLTLVSACVPRREAVSGWDYAKRGPKAVRWLVPAGSVFFFEAEGDTSALASSAWLAPVSDNDQDRRDGYGLAVWGMW